ncbi:MAG: class I SAM-dependent methyltransferase, partial [Anaerolineales bacterium]|nr:class I SAM-dependent methyltransferase [Anaerolineales bacterium]
FADDWLEQLNYDGAMVATLLESEADAMQETESDAAGAAQTLVERFGVPPFSVLDARQGYWQDRKRAWLGLGLRGEVGRLAQSNALPKTFKNSTQANQDDTRLDLDNGTSIFDPVLSEILYRWFVPKGGHVLNPMSGEATHGIVAGYLGYEFTGVELRPEQAESNREQAVEIGVNPVWITADALTIDQLDIAPADFVVSCPPYADLEVYSDNPLDISTMDYADFVTTYSEIIRKSCALLKENRFAAFVVGEARDKRGIYYDFVGDTIKAFKAAGLNYYNEMIYVTPLGTVMMQTSRNFPIGRKIGKTHQNVLVFVKGDWREAVKACGKIDMELPDGFDTNS